MDLYNNGNMFDVDLTYGNGGFWKEFSEQPKIRIDLADKKNLTIRADSQRIPLLDHSINSVVIDPPFLHAAGKDSIMGNQFGSYKSQKALRDMYRYSLYEITRILKIGGICVFKCQDIIESGKQNWNHIYVRDICEKLCNLMAEDLFILTGKSVIIGHNHHVQKHARKNHSYFWVFRKVLAMPYPCMI